jgi:hypothetical protein
MTQEDNERRLIHIVEQQRDDECRKLLERAQSEARDLLRKTYRRVRRRLHAEVTSERERAHAKITASRGELETRRRQHQKLVNAVILEAARERLPAKLTQRWQDPKTRANWITTALEQALEKLPKGSWHIRHPAALDTEECAASLRALQDQLPQPLELEADPGLHAGLVITCAGVVLDTSTGGLLEDREAVEARLLALIELESDT